METRAQIAKKVAQKEKEQKEHGLRQMAQKARDERQGIKTSSTGGGEARFVFLYQQIHCLVLTRIVFVQDLMMKHGKEKN